MWHRGGSERVREANVKCPILSHERSKKAPRRPHGQESHAKIGSECPRMPTHEGVKATAPFLRQT
eukprot:8288275-Pyramimonas_sp.AAC.1